MPRHRVDAGCWRYASQGRVALDSRRPEKRRGLAMAIEATLVLAFIKKSPAGAGQLMTGCLAIAGRDTPKYAVKASVTPRPRRMVPPLRHAPRIRADASPAGQAGQGRPAGARPRAKPVRVSFRQLRTWHRIRSAPLWAISGLPALQKRSREVGLPATCNPFPCDPDRDTLPA
jgi:hypothetical protein